MEQDYILKKWLNDELSTEESGSFKQSEDAALNEAIVNGAKLFKAPLSNQIPVFKDFDKKRLTQTKKVHFQPWLTWVSGVAAILVLSFGISNWLNPSLVKVNTSVAESKNLTLPDQSEVVLNAQSSISYDKASWNEKRHLTLEGEAFFDVATGALFDVETSEGKISVLGTEFNIRQRGSILQVVCYEGSVRVTTTGDTIILLPGDAVSYTHGNKTTSTIAEKAPSWRTGMSMFKDVPLSEVLAEIPIYYNVVVSTVKVDVTKHVNVSFEHNDVNLALTSIAQPLGLTYHIKGNQVTLKPREE